MGIFDYFDRVRIINLPKRSDRRNETIQEFSRHQFPIGNGVVDFFPAFSPVNADGFPNAGVRGCYLSHKQVIDDALRDRLSNVLILEDDICFTKLIGGLSESIIQELSALDWDIAYFGHSFEAKESTPFWKLATEPTIRAHFYAVNRKALPILSKFLSELLTRPTGHPDGGPMHYDGALNTFREQNPDINVYFYTLNLGYQRPSKTDLHDTSFYDNAPLLRPIMWVMRKVKGKLLRLRR